MSRPVDITRLPNGIALVRMQDRAGKNTFTPALIGALLDAFRCLGADDSIKVVVISGYDSYFCSGGSKEELLRIVSGEITFENLGFYRTLLDCPVPTIAAMQGHAIGGGLAFGCFADLIVLAEESLYSANFMKYGFTPGMGATCILPFKFGPVIGAEMLLTARNYQGEELKRRGVNATVLRRAEVLDHALRLAGDLAEKPRTALMLLKSELVRGLRVQLAVAVERELSMHAVTLSEDSIRQRVLTLFGE